MKANKKLLGVLVLLMVSSTNAKTYFDDSTQRALIYYSQDQNINASVCEQVTEEDLRKSLQDVLRTKCTQLSTGGLSKQDIEAKLPELKEQMLTAMASLGNMMSGFGSVMSKEDISDPQNMLSSMMSGLFQKQKKIIEDLTADQVFLKYQLDAKVPTLEMVKKSEDLDSEIEQFVLLTKK